MTRKNVAILISGSGSNMVSLVKSMEGADHPAKPVLVLANQPDATGLEKARAMTIPTQLINHCEFATKADFETALHDALTAAQTDIICLAGFMRVLSPEFIRKWDGKILNIHPSILPLFKGLNTHQRALDAGMAVHGCTVHEVTAELDGGPILGQAVLPIADNDTAESLAKRLLPLEHKLYPRVLERFAQGIKEPLALF